MSYVDYERTVHERTLIEAALVLYREGSQLDAHQLVAPAEVLDRFRFAARDLHVAMGNDDLDDVEDACG